MFFFKCYSTLCMYVHYSLHIKWWGWQVLVCAWVFFFVFPSFSPQNITDGYLAKLTEQICFWFSFVPQAMFLPLLFHSFLFFPINKLAFLLLLYSDTCGFKPFPGMDTVIILLSSPAILCWFFNHVILILCSSLKELYGLAFEVPPITLCNLLRSGYKACFIGVVCI